LELKPMPSLSTLARRSRAHFAQRRRASSFSAELETVPRDDLFELGDLNYGGYVLPASLIDQDSICYLAGTGEDISFDLGVIARFGCTVHSLDPVPRAAAHVAAAAAFEPRLVFHSAALWSSDQTLTFHAPREKGYVSQSAINLHDTEPDFTASARAVSSLMAELGHDHIDLLKVSAEGSEYEIVDHIVAADIDVRVLCVEYAQPAPVERVRESIRNLESSGYVLAAASVRTWNWKLTFVGSTAADAKRPTTHRGKDDLSTHHHSRQRSHLGRTSGAGVTGR
jgi:FkbM family methyltransferase